MTTKSFIDERTLAIWTSPSGKYHVEGWFSESLCGFFVDRANDWHWSHLTSVRFLGKMAQGYVGPQWCKRCLAHYKDVNING